MSRHDVAFLACRLLALWVFIEVLVSLPSYVSQSIYYAAEHDLATAAIMACGPGAQLVLVALVWFFSPAICVRLLPPDGDSTPSLRVNSNALLGVAIAAIGVFYTSTALNWLIVEIYAARFESSTPPGWHRGRVGIAQAIIESLIGVLLIAQARRIVVWVRGLQRYARQRASP